MRKKFFKKCLASTMALALVITGTNSIPALAAKKASVSLKKTSVSVTVGKNVKLSVVKKNVKKVKTASGRYRNGAERVRLRNGRRRYFRRNVISEIRRKCLLLRPEYGIWRN